MPTACRGVCIANYSSEAIKADKPSSPPSHSLNTTASTSSWNGSSNRRRLPLGAADTSGAADALDALGNKLGEQCSSRDMRFLA